MADASVELRKFVAPELVFGIGARHLAGRYARNYGLHRVLLVTDPGVLAAGWALEARDELRRSGLEVVVYSQVSENPSAEEVSHGVALFAAEECDGIVVVGGGSSIDCAKGIGIVASNGGFILDYEGIDKVLQPIAPLIALPTTAGSAADVSQFAIITDVAHFRKVALVSKAIVPDVSLFDPVTLTTLANEVTINTGLDALTHAIEAYVSNASSPITDLFALEAIRLVRAALPLVVARPLDMGLRSQTMIACIDAGMAFSNASLGAVHAMAHALGGRLGLPHGLCNGMLLPAVVGFNFEAAGARYRDVAAAMGLPVEALSSPQVEQLLIEGLREFLDSLGIPRSFGGARLGPAEIASMAAFAEADPCLVTNPRWPERGQLEAIYAGLL